MSHHHRRNKMCCVIEIVLSVNTSCWVVAVFLQLSIDALKVFSDGGEFYQKQIFAKNSMTVHAYTVSAVHPLDPLCCHALSPFPSQICGDLPHQHHVIVKWSWAYITNHCILDGSQVKSYTCHSRGICLCTVSEYVYLKLSVHTRTCLSELL